MTFGKAPGPPASAQQMRRLMELINGVGHEDFRDARGPLGLNQRQAAGRFTREEAESLIDQLESESGSVESEAKSASPTMASKSSASERRVREFSDSVLAAELQRRGWIVVEP